MSYIDTPQDFRSKYRGIESRLKRDIANDDHSHAWHDFYWIRAFVDMFQITLDEFWLGEAVKLIDHILSGRDDRRFKNGDFKYNAAPNVFIKDPGKMAPGWRRDWRDGWRMLMLDNGQICHAIMRFVEAASTHPKASKYLTDVLETVNAFLPNFAFNKEFEGSGSFYYPSYDGTRLFDGAVQLNHNCTMAIALMLIDKVRGTNEFDGMVRSIWDWWKREIKVVDNAFVWAYDLQKSGSVEDLQHGHLDIAYAMLNFQRGLGVTGNDLVGYANTYNKMYRGNGTISWKVDGSEGMKTSEPYAASYDWVLLSQIDPSIHPKARDVLQKHATILSWGKPALAWSQLLRAEKGVASPPVEPPGEEPPTDGQPPEGEEPPPDDIPEEECPDEHPTREDVVAMIEGHKHPEYVTFDKLNEVVRVLSQSIQGKLSPADLQHLRIGIMNPAPEKKNQAAEKKDAAA